MEVEVSRGKPSTEPGKREQALGELAARRVPQGGLRRARGTGAHRPDGPGGRSRALRPASARGLKYYPGVFNYLFLMDLQGLFHQARGGWVWGCGERGEGWSWENGPYFNIKALYDRQQHERCCK